MNIKVLLRRNTLLLISGQMVSMFGSMLQRFALSLYVLDVTGSGVKFASVLAVAMIPQLIFGPFGGVIADKFNRKWLIVILDAISGVVTLTFALIYFINGQFSMTAIYILVFLLAVVASVFEPTITSIIPDIVEKKELVEVNSSVSLVSSMVAILGPVLGGILYGAWGIFILMIINGISYLISALSEMFIKPDRSHHEENSDLSFFESFKEGFMYVIKTPTLVIFAFVAVIANTAISPIFSIGLPFRLRSEIGVSDFIYGLSGSLIMVGAVFGSILASSLVKKITYTKMMSFALTITAFILFGVSVISIPGFLSNTASWISLTTLFFVIIALVIITNITIGTAKQKLVPGKILGRVNGVLATLATASIPLGQMVYGGMLEKNDMYIVTLIFAVVLLISGIMAYTGFGYLKRKDMLLEVEDEK